MKDKKNIDNLFEESFKNFEATPSPQVWENIQKELDKEKRDRKPIPLWIKYGGVAALLALLLTVGNFVFNPNDILQNSITNENNVNPIEETQNAHEILNLDSKENKIATEVTEINKKEIQKSDSSSSNGLPQNINSEKSNKNSTQVAISQKDFQDEISNEEDGKTNHLNKGDQQKITSENGMAAVKNKSVSSEKIEDSSKLPKSDKNEILNNGKNILEDQGNAISITEKSIENPEDAQKIDLTEDSKNKKSILDAIAENNEDDKALKVEKDKPENRWIVTPNVAPVYYSSLGNGSSIDPDFTNSPQKGDVNMSYGLQVSYALSNRLSVRTGLNNLDLSYSTSDIVIGTGPVSRALGSVDYGTKQIVVTAISRESLAHGNPSNGFGDITLKSTSGDARLIQSINYYEVPLELKYAVIDSKFGINLIGGLSTMFLGNNEISVKSDNFSSVLGEANNLSSVSFSTNVGLGLDYKLSKKIIFNVEPMFKYQLNPYTDSTVNFKPYYLGVYSGLSFKF